MCVAELNVSLNSCSHRWYHLVRSCVEGANLLSCPSKLALEGWEIKCDFCPFCAGWPLDGGDFMLLGGNPHSRSSSFSSPLSRTSSLTTSVSAARRDSRRGSMARSDTSSIMSAAGSPVFTAGEKNRAMNQRVDLYFVQLPETITETQQKRPGTSGTVWGNWAMASPEDDTVDNVRRGSASTSSSASTKVVAEKAGKAWKTAKRRSRDLSSFFR